MSKKFSFEFVPFTYEQLKSMTTEELQMNMIKFKRLIREARKFGKETSVFEVEFCYLDNEHQARSRFERPPHRYSDRESPRYSDRESLSRNRVDRIGLQGKNYER